MRGQGQGQDGGEWIQLVLLVLLVVAIILPRLGLPSHGGPGTVSLRLTNCVVAGNQGTDSGGGIVAGNTGVAGSALTLAIVSSTITFCGACGASLTWAAAAGVASDPRDRDAIG